MKAFPSQGYKDGMDLRDYFAAKALQGMLTNSTYMIEDAPVDMANEAYGYADAMMEARKK
jgi:hypothetical protein